MSLDKMLMVLSLVILAILPLMADKVSGSTLSAQAESPIPNVHEFSITYLGEALVCSPTGLIKTKTRKDLVTYQCQNKYADDKSEKKQDEARGNAETKRLRDQVKNKIAKGAVYSVQIPLYAAQNSTKARFIAEQQLNNKPYGKYIRMFLPAKIYLSIRPQFANSGEDGKMELRNAGSRGGFFYYHQFNSDLELAFHYEAKVDWDEDTPFINTSDTSDSTRRLSYFALKSGSNSIVLGKYWSAYYDIAGLTDQYMAYGAQASGAFNSGTDGSPSGTGRADVMLQARTSKEVYDAALQVQFRHDALREFDTDYLYTMAGSFIYKGWEDVRMGASLAYGKFDKITPDMQAVDIDGNDWSSIIGLVYKKDNYSVSTTFSYTKNHMSDDQGVYFDGVGAELYMRYDIDESFRLAGGGNWLLPSDNTYEGEYSIKDFIFSLQYTFGEKTFDDLVYLEVSLPNGKLANGNKRDTSIAIGLRYLFDN